MTKRIKEFLIILGVAFLVLFCGLGMIAFANQP